MIALDKDLRTFLGGVGFIALLFFLVSLRNCDAILQKDPKDPFLPVTAEEKQAAMLACQLQPSGMDSLLSPITVTRGPKGGVIVTRDYRTLRGWSMTEQCITLGGRVDDVKTDFIHEGSPKLKRDSTK